MQSIVEAVIKEQIIGTSEYAWHDRTVECKKISETNITSSNVCWGTSSKYNLEVVGGGSDQWNYLEKIFRYESSKLLENEDLTHVLSSG